MRLVHKLGLQIPTIRRLHQSRNQLMQERDQLAEACRALNVQIADCLDTAARLQAEIQERPVPIASPFYHYTAAFDAQETIRRHMVSGLVPHPGYLTNFLGVLVPPGFLPDVIRPRIGQVEEPPIPANWHADIAEWAAALHAVEQARGRFRIIELGCGWGCWLNNTGVAARRLGLDIQLIGVEGDANHINSATQTCLTNGFSPGQFTLHRGIAAASSGMALFPRQEGVHWGGQPIFNASEAERRELVTSGLYDELPMVSLADLCADHDRIDLLHIDIQGGEADLIEQCLDILTRKIAYVLIGTHSRSLEGRLVDTLTRAGWHLEVERPAILGLNAVGPYVEVDGVQFWRNPSPPD